MEYPFVSIIIPTFNSGKYIEECLISIFSMNYPKKSYEVIIVDGNSTDDTIQILEKFSVSIINNPKVNAAAGRNLGIKNAKGQYIAFTDSDCIVDTNWLNNAIEKIHYSSNDNLVCVGGPNFSPSVDSKISHGIAISQDTILGSGGSPQSQFKFKDIYVYSLPNCNAIYKKSILLEVGLFDENFRIGQDAELNFRIHSMNKKFLYSKDVIVLHYRRSNFITFALRMFFYGYAMAQITRKHRKIIRWYSVITGLILVSLFLCPIITLINPFLINVYGIAAIIYAISLGITSFSVLKRYKTLLFLLTPVFLVLQHFSYGIGFLFGIADYKKRLFMS